MRSSLYYPVNAVLLWAAVGCLFIARYRTPRWHESMSPRIVGFASLSFAYFFAVGVERFFEKAIGDPLPWVQWVAVADLAGRGILLAGAVALWIRKMRTVRPQADRFED